MHRDHPPKMWFGNFVNALLFKVALVASRNHQFRKPLDPD
jgi:hypothetical protein